MTEVCEFVSSSSCFLPGLSYLDYSRHMYGVHIVKYLYIFRID